MESLRPLLPVVEEASALSLRFFRERALRYDSKEDGSLVTEADLAVDALLFPALQAHFPDAAIISEERPEPTSDSRRTLVYLDPIDGTTAFASGAPGFCISIGVIRDGEPVGGIVAAPAWGTTWFCDLSKDLPVLCNGTAVSQRSSSGDLTQRSTALVDSKLHHGFDLIGYPGRCRSFGSTALHMCLVAGSGSYDIAHSGRVYPWDVAGAHAIAKRAGLKLEYLGQAPLIYEHDSPARRLQDDVLVGGRVAIEQFRGCLHAKG